MIVDNIVYVIGRGNIVVTQKEKNNPVHINDKIKISDNIFEITGIEHSEYMRMMGLILRPNPLVKEAVKIRDKIIVLHG